jgi:hypothetical protein
VESKKSIEFSRYDRDLESISRDSQKIISDNSLRRVPRHEYIHEQIQILVDRMSESLNNFLVGIQESI